MGLGLGFLSPFYDDNRINVLLSLMDTRQRVGQLFLFSLGGKVFSPEMEYLVAKAHAGGLVLFSQNIGTPSELTELTNRLQQSAVENGLPIPLFIAADQEGGRVLRMAWAPFTPFPSAMALGATHNPDFSYEVGLALAQEMYACGLNLNLAPVLDVNTHADNPVINIRSFGADAALVAEHGAAFVRGLQAGGVAATGKHFPGHGSTETDSHYDLPLVTLERPQLLSELSPFVRAIENGLDAVMTAHVLYPAFDPNQPATFSSRILSGLLRQQIGFQGVVISDALTMRAVSLAQNEPIYVLRDAFLAGVDMLAFGVQPDGTPPSLEAQNEILEMMVALAESGLISPQRLEESVRRVLKLKARFGLLDWRPLDTASATGRLNSTPHQALVERVAENSITLLSDSLGLLPLRADEPLALLYPDPFPLLGEILSADFSDLLSLPYSLSPSPAEAERLAAQVRGRKVLCLTLDTYKHKAQVNLINALPLAQTVVVATQSPYDILNFPLVQTYLMTYGFSPPTLGVLWRILRGEIRPKGVLPVSLF